MTEHLRRFGDQFEIEIKPDEDRFTGRECPDSECEGYFKVEFGTGMEGDELPCYCPYCGTNAPHDEFWTKAQIEYAESRGRRQATNAFLKDLKALEFDRRPKGAFGTGLSMKLKPGTPIPIRYYKEESLETEVVCDACTLRFAIYGVFGFCPDCGRRNSIQILNKCLDVVAKHLALVDGVDPDLAVKLKEDALGSIVSAFDGFGREECRFHASAASAPRKAENMSFQNLAGAERQLRELFDIELAGALKANEWQFVKCCFQKRHLFAHKLGVVDAEYVAKANDSDAVVGRKVVITADEILNLAGLVRQLGQSLHSRFSGRSGL